MRPSATSVCGLQLLVYEALSTSVCGFKVLLLRSSVAYLRMYLNRHSYVAFGGPQAGWAERVRAALKVKRYLAS